MRKRRKRGRAYVVGEREDSVEERRLFFPLPIFIQQFLEKRGGKGKRMKGGMPKEIWGRSERGTVRGSRCINACVITVSCSAIVLAEIDLNSFALIDALISFDSGSDNYYRVRGKSENGEKGKDGKEEEKGES